MIELRRYQFEDKRVPVTEWLSDLRDVSARAQIEVRLRRISVQTSLTIFKNIT